MNDVDYQTNVKKWLATQFQIKDLDMRNVFKDLNCSESQEQITSHVSSILYRQNVV